jgi:tetratricopeptide (TPR) repeat protein
LWLRGRYADAVAVGYEALELAQGQRLESHAAQVRTHLGLARVINGDMRGLLDLQRSIRAQQGRGRPIPPIAWGNLAYAYSCLGDERRCFAAINHGDEAANRFESIPQSRWLEAMHVFRLYWTGRWSEALQLIETFVTESANGRPHYMEGPCRLRRGLILLARGQEQAALDESEEVLTLARNSRSSLGMEPALAFRARVLLVTGHAKDATVLVEELLGALAERPTLDPGVGVDLADVLQSLGRTSVALRGTVKVPTRWFTATELALQGDLLAAARLYDRIGAEPEAAYTRLKAARNMPSSKLDPGMEAEMDSAMAFFQTAGASAYLAEARRLRG